MDMEPGGKRRGETPAAFSRSKALEGPVDTDQEGGGGRGRREGRERKGKAGTQRREEGELGGETQRGVLSSKG